MRDRATTRSDEHALQAAFRCDPVPILERGEEIAIEAAADA